MDNRITFTRPPIALDALAWTIDRAGEALEVLARRAGLQPNQVQTTVAPPANLDDRPTLERWVALSAAHLGIETEPVEVTYADTDAFVQGGGPALLLLPPRPGPRLILLLAARLGRATVIAPDLALRRVPQQYLCDALCEPLEAPWASIADGVLREAGVPAERMGKVRRLILAEQLRSTPVEVGWMLRLPPAASMWRQVVRADLFQPIVLIVGAMVVLQILLLITWWIIGQGVLSGQIDWVWIWAWAGLQLSMVPFQMLLRWSQGTYAIGMGSLFKQRLLSGILQLSPEEIRHQGMGQFLGRVMDASAVEQLALGGGMLGLVACLQLVTAVFILAAGAGGWLHAGLLLLWIGLAVVLSWRFALQTIRWAIHYRYMTNALVERMVGHRTRLAQEDQRQWHTDEDRELDQYIQQSMQVGDTGRVLAAMPRGWVFVGLAAIAPLLVNGGSTALLSVTLGGILLASQALTSAIGGLQSVVAVLNAWQQVAPLFHAATRHDTPPPLDLNLRTGAAPADQALLVARDLSFRYRDRGAYQLQGCSIQIHPADRLLLEGPSGGGKSTLAAVVAGLRVPASGLLLLWGYDQQTVGAAAWRQRVAVAPQFHENYIFSDTLAFNLLLGRRWPPRNEDMNEAMDICEELGLGGLLARMPSGMQQILGESGWQLSHGERSRLYIARALLQRADLVIMDESFGALDPETLHMALRTVLRRAPALLVIAHP